MLDIRLWQPVSPRVLSIKAPIIDLGRSPACCARADRPPHFKGVRFAVLRTSTAGRVSFGAHVALHVNDRGRISGAHALTSGLRVFYQFLAGATPDERDRFNFEELASSGYYRLPGGPFNDDAAHEEYNVFLDAKRSRAQRDHLAMDLHAMLSAFVTELRSSSRARAIDRAVSKPSNAMPMDTQHIASRWCRHHTPRATLIAVLSG
ncbi:hypothetical protein EXIGLDRAFT_837097 [Exidia glandulosa HHB12029]|uniref:Uncharacterized protein n=1 Tax=Exidia glandulosa HHB12029 TaxID=1314781 RepID=A0A165H499_EXIGL|nr:hypothetical protein EXIGLDRAFT_837097 [Exidia glandulosa HHB12029]